LRYRSLRKYPGVPNGVHVLLCKSNDIQRVDLRPSSECRILPTNIGSLVPAGFKLNSPCSQTGARGRLPMDSWLCGLYTQQQLNMKSWKFSTPHQQLQRRMHHFFRRQLCMGMKEASTLSCRN